MKKWLVILFLIIGFNGCGGGGSSTSVDDDGGNNENTNPLNNGILITKFTYKTPTNILLRNFEVTIGDLNNDTKNDILIWDNAGSHLNVLDYNGSLLLEKDMVLSEDGNGNDGESNIVNNTIIATVGSHYIKKLNSNGDILWTNNIGGLFGELAKNPIVADLDNDGTNEIIVTNKDKYLTIINDNNGSNICQSNQQASIFGMPVIVNDLNENGKKEIIALRQGGNGNCEIDIFENNCSKKYTYDASVSHNSAYYSDYKIDILDNNITNIIGINVYDIFIL